MPADAAKVRPSTAARPAAVGGGPIRLARDWPNPQRRLDALALHQPQTRIRSNGWLDGALQLSSSECSDLALTDLTSFAQ